MLKTVLLAFLAGVSLTCAAQSAPQGKVFPGGPVKIIVPYPPGGGMDVLIRAIAPELSARWKQPVVIENRGGAGGIIGTQAVANAEPNGETLLATIDTPLTANRYLFKSLPYDPDKGFAPVIMITRNYNLILANASFPGNDLRELVTSIKASGQKLNYGSYGHGSHPHLVYGMLAAREGLDLTHVPYKGAAPVITALLANEIPLSTGTVATAGAHIRAGTIKALAYASPRRSVHFPNVPTTAELGLDYLVSPIWMALFAPAGTPPSIIDRINADVRAIVTQPDFAERNIVARGQEVVAGTPAELGDAVRDDSAAIGEMVGAIGLKPE